MHDLDDIFGNTGGIATFRVQMFAVEHLPATRATTTYHPSWDHQEVKKILMLPVCECVKTYVCVCVCVPVESESEVSKAFTQRRRDNAHGRKSSPRPPPGF